MIHRSCVCDITALFRRGVLSSPQMLAGDNKHHHEALGLARLRAVSVKVIHGLGSPQEHHRRAMMPKLLDVIVRVSSSVRTNRCADLCLHV